MSAGPLSLPHHQPDGRSSAKQSKAQRERACLQAILGYCAMERSIEEIGRLLGRAPAGLRTLLNDLVRQGKLERVGRDGYRAPQADLFNV